MSPGVDREYTTHHYACDCREARFTALLEQAEHAMVKGWIAMTAHLAATAKLCTDDCTDVEVMTEARDDTGCALDAIRKWLEER